MSHRLLPTRPELYHGKDNNRTYFEGWYFKIATNDLTIAIICGVSRSKKIEDDHSFIQIITGEPCRSYYIRYKHDEFAVQKNSFEVSIAGNFFSYDRLKLNIDSPYIKIDANLQYVNHMYLKVNPICPSIMGPFSYIPNMQCNHGVLSLKNNVSGAILLNGKKHILNDALGYIEKDWGSAFPNSWVWLQGNVSKKNEENITFMCSVASIPFGAVKFKGLIANLTIGNDEFRFATYNGTKIKLIKQLKNDVEIHLKKGSYLLKITANSDNFEKLIAPTKTGMDGELFESINAQIQLQLFSKKNIIFETVLINCGMEISEIKELIK